MARKIYATTIDKELLDTNIYNNITVDSSKPVQPSLGTTSTKAAGIVKLVNMFLKILYTYKGTNYLNKNEGTYFTSLFNLNVQDIGVAESKVQDAIDEASAQIMGFQSIQGVPDSEKLRRAYISNFELDDDDTVLMEINIEVVSGVTTAVQLPSITLDNV